MNWPLHFKKIFIYLWLCWVFIVAFLSSVAVSGDCSLAAAHSLLIGWRLIAEHRL